MLAARYELGVVSNFAHRGAPRLRNGSSADGAIAMSTEDLLDISLDGSSAVYVAGQEVRGRVRFFNTRRMVLRGECYFRLDTFSGDPWATEKGYPPMRSLIGCQL